MIKVPVWVLKQLAKAGKVRPEDMMTQSTIDDVLHLVKEILF